MQVTNDKTSLGRSQWLGIAIFALLVVYAFTASLWLQGDANSQDLMRFLTPPSAELWLGADQFGRNMWLRLAEALQLSMTLALLCVLTSVVLGVTLGVLAATFGGVLDRALDVLVTSVLALPGLMLVLIIAALAPGELWAIYLAIALIQWVEFFRVSRAAVIRLAASPAVESSRLMGFGQGYIFRRHYWPELAPQLLTLSAFGASQAVLMMASLGFVYVGIQPPQAELGQMIVELFPFYSEAPWLLAQPVLVLSLLVLAFQLISRREAS